MSVDSKNEESVAGPNKRCSKCGCELPAETPEIDCPVCLVRWALSDGTGSDGAVEFIDRFGDYVLLEQIGVGGMGVVYRARHKNVDSEVGLKLLHGHYGSNEELVARFQREIQALARMNHENIVHIREHGKVGDRLYFTMDWIDGRDLGHELRLANGALPPSQVARIMRDVALAIDHAHYQGVLHRDLKPENIILDRSGKPWLTDFGVARFLNEESTEISQDGQVIGTLRYSAPEQIASGGGLVERTTDVYGLGAVCFHLLTGHPPFEGNTTELLRDIVDNEPLPPRAFVNELHPDLESCCLKCLQKDPRDRYPSAGVFAEDLNRFLNKRPVTARPLNVVQRTWRWSRRKPLLASLIGGTTLLCLFSFWLLIQMASQATQHRTAIRDGLFSEAVTLANSEGQGQHYLSLERLSEAARMGPSEALRDQMVAAFALFDVRDSQVWTPPSVWFASYCAELDLRLYAEKMGSDTLFLESTLTSERRCVLRSPTADGFVEGFTLGPFGKLAFVNTRLPDGLRQTILWDLGRTNRVGAWRRGNHVVPSFSPQGNEFAMFDTENDLISRHQLPSGERKGVIKVDDPIHKLAYGVNGKRLLGWSHDSPLITICDLETGQALAPIKASKRIAGTACWHPTGRYVAASASDNRVYVWSVESGREVARVSGHSRPATVSFHPHGSILMTAGQDRVTRFWDVFSEKLLLTVSHWNGVQFNQTGDHVLSFSGNTHRVSRLAPDKVCRHLVGHLEGNHYARYLSFSPDGERLMSAGSDGASIWDVSSGGHLEHLRSEIESDAYAAEFGISEQELIDWRPGEGVRKRRLDSLEMNEADKAFSNTSLGLWPITLPDPIGPLTDRRRRWVLSFDPSDFLQVLSLNKVSDSNSNSVRLQVNAESLTFAALSATGRWAITAEPGSDSLQVWNSETGEPVTSLEHSELSRCGVAFDASDGLVVSGGWKHYKIWRPEDSGDWSLEKRLPRNEGMLFSACAVAPDGSWIAITPDSRRVDLYAAPRWERMTTLAVPNPGVIRCIRICPFGRYVAVASENHVIHLWDLETLDQELVRRAVSPLARQ